MMSFRGEKVVQDGFAGSTGWLLSEVSEFKGKQDLYTRQAPQVLKALREHALIQSAESSNRIEGVTVAADRLAPLVLGNAKPKDRSEEEVQQYRIALNLVHTESDALDVSPATLLKLHGIIQQGVGDAGQWKAKDNEIIELVPGESPRIRFRPTPATETAAAIDELCLSWKYLLSQDRAPVLVLIFAFVLDFLCIHPFRDGNGRVSRLLTLLLLYRSGYEVGRFISIERLIEESKEDYYSALQRSSAGWHEGKHELAPWLNHSLGILRRAYSEFADRVEQVSEARGGKSALVREAIASFVRPFQFSELQRLCPGVSDETIKLVLREMKEQGQISSSGRGRGAKWANKGNNA